MLWDSTTAGEGTAWALVTLGLSPSHTTFLLVTELTLYYIDTVQRICVWEEGKKKDRSMVSFLLLLLRSSGLNTLQWQWPNALLSLAIVLNSSGFAHKLLQKCLWIAQVANTSKSSGIDHGWEVCLDPSRFFHQLPALQASALCKHKRSTEAPFAFMFSLLLVTAGLWDEGEEADVLQPEQQTVWIYLHREHSKVKF